SIESGPGVQMMTRDRAAETTAALLARMNLGPGEWSRLLQASPTDLLAVQAQFTFIAPDQTVRPRGSRPGPIGFSPVVDGVALPQHPFDPGAPAVSRAKPLMVGWNEDEYTFFAWQQRDTSGFGLDLAGLRAKLEPRFGADTSRIIDTYRQSRPPASPTDIFVEVSS